MASQVSKMALCTIGTQEAILDSDTLVALDVSAELAASKALGIVELLECILSHLPCKDVLLAQRVSKTWQSTMISSSLLQQSLCLLPSAQPSSELTLFLANKVPTIVTRKYRQFRANKGPQRYLKKSITAQEVWNEFSQPGKHLLNPLFHKVFKGWKNEDGRAYKIEASKIKSCSAQVSWKKMYLSQPPTTQLQIRRIPGPCRANSTDMSNEDSEDEDSEDEDDDNDAHDTNEVGYFQNLSGITLDDLASYVNEKFLGASDKVMYLAVLGHRKIKEDTST